MSIRKIKDAKDLDTNELIYFKGHAQATFMSNGWTVEDAVNQKTFAGYPKVELVRESFVNEYILSPYTYYHFTFNDVELGTFPSEIDIILDKSNTNIVGEFVIEFYIPLDSSSPQISFPSDILWANGIIPDFQWGYTYIICITNNIACFVKCEI